MITWSLMLASGSAQDDTFASFEDLWSDPTLMGFSDYPSETDFYSQLSSAQGIISLASEIIMHVFGIDSLKNTVSTKIALVNAADGKELDARIFPGALAIEYPVGNLTEDLLPDSIEAAYGLNESSQNITTAIAAIDSSSRATLWKKTFSCLALAVPASDLTADGKDELVVYLISFANNTTSCDMEIIHGADGRMLWQRSFGNSLAVATAGPDLTGDGKKDLIVYRFGEFGDSEVQAVKGDDGELLWTKTGMIIMPIGHRLREESRCSSSLGSKSSELGRIKMSAVIPSQILLSF